ncbi:hypothetical protein BGZ73_004352 [Actinomortierella ambigua]|nr:hypothetical protein BGZ73_004352 [Actinomortierella ambigua]
MALTIGRVVGQGGYGTVHFGRWQGQACAVKQVLLSESEYQHIAIQKEIMLLQQLRHRHIIQFYKSFHHNGQLVIVMDFAEGGSLRHVIEETNSYNNGGSRRHTSLGSSSIHSSNSASRGEQAVVHLLQGWEDRTRIAQEIARGLAYMHSENILHRDLKSANVLLTRHMEVRLCDFGMATVKTTSASKSLADDNDGAVGGGGLKGTLRWMAPELLDLRPTYSTKSDIYALGMVMWEMAANCTTPFRDQPNQHVVMVSVVNGKREAIPDHTPFDYQKWIERCWEQDPAKRPDAKEMVGHIDEPEANFADLGYQGSTVNVTSEMISNNLPGRLPPFNDDLSSGNYASHELSFNSSAESVSITQSLRRPLPVPSPPTMPRGQGDWAQHSLPPPRGNSGEGDVDQNQRNDPTLFLGPQIGYGIYGTVYKGKWARQVCAVKKIRSSYAQHHKVVLDYEVRIMERLRHRHVTQFYGTSYHHGSLVIISELAEGGCLEDALQSSVLFPETMAARGSGRPSVNGVGIGDWPTKERLVQEIASGLAYIHDHGIIHRNLRSCNVMLTKDGRAKLTSFALAIEISPAPNTTEESTYAELHRRALVGSQGWMAPELLSTSVQPIPYSVKSDMYAFGMVMWELATHLSMPFRVLKDDASVFTHVLTGVLEHIPEHTPSTFRLWIERCFDSCPANRPNAEDILNDEDDDF